MCILKKKNFNYLADNYLFYIYLKYTSNNIYLKLSIYLKLRLHKTLKSFLFFLYIYTVYKLASIYK